MVFGRTLTRFWLLKAGALVRIARGGWDNKFKTICFRFAFPFLFSRDLTFEAKATSAEHLPGIL